MIKPRCRSKLCMLVCAWLWISGLVLMGEILRDLNSLNIGATTRAVNVDAVGSLQIFFLFYTIACLALYFLWQKQVKLNGELKSTHSTV